MDDQDKRAVSVLLNRLASVLDERFGPHPTVPLETLKPIAAEVVGKSEFENKETLLAEMNGLIELAYKRGEVPTT